MHMAFEIGISLYVLRVTQVSDSSETTYSLAKAGCTYIMPGA